MAGAAPETFCEQEASRRRGDGWAAGLKDARRHVPAPLISCRAFLPQPRGGVFLGALVFEGWVHIRSALFGRRLRQRRRAQTRWKRPTSGGAWRPQPLAVRTALDPRSRAQVMSVVYSRVCSDGPTRRSGYPCDLYMHSLKESGEGTRTTRLSLLGSKIGAPVDSRGVAKQPRFGPLRRLQTRATRRLATRDVRLSAPTGSILLCRVVFGFACEITGCGGPRPTPC